jgi:hypothetical protein
LVGPQVQHARVQPFLDVTHDAPVCDPVPDELHEPSVVQRVEEPADVRIEHVAHFLRADSHRQRVQCHVRAAARAKTTGLSDFPGSCIVIVLLVDS